jgi:predicted phosphodiesterase
MKPQALQLLHKGDIMKILFAGDTHGNDHQIDWLYWKAVAVGADLIWVCGDFGYWPHYEFGQEFLDKVTTNAEQTGIPLWFVDGNHENHDLLDAYLAQQGNSEPIELAPHLYWTPRGMTVELDGVTFMSYGGAWSVDWDRRTPHVTWWEQELISPAHIASLPHDLNVDVLVTHEAPLANDCSSLSYKDEYPVSVRQRQLVTLLAEKVGARHLFCGHHHTRASYKAATPQLTQVNVLAHDGDQPSCYMLVNTADLKQTASV